MMEKSCSLTKFQLCIVIQLLLLPLSASQLNLYYITNLTVLEGKESLPPKDFELMPADLNEGTKGQSLYFAFKRGTSEKEAIKDIMIVDGEVEDIPVPNHFIRVDTDLNQGADGYYVYAAFTRDEAKGNPITKMFVVVCDSDNDDECVCRDPDMYKIPVDLNKGAGGKFIYLCFRRFNIAE